jgi:predicted cupin superfamily sugar epimerase
MAEQQCAEGNLIYPSAADLIRMLELQPHPEGGYYREVYRASMRVQHPEVGAKRAAATSIYYLLEPGNFSAFHKVRSDEIWHHYLGDTLELHIIEPEGVRRVVRLGRELERGERPISVVAAGEYQAAIAIGPSYALLGCTVAPGFEFADLEMASRRKMLTQFPQHTDLIRRFTRS